MGFKTFWALAVLLACGAVVGAWVCNGKTGKDEAPQQGNGPSFYRYAHCFSQLTPDHFTDTEETKQGIVSKKYRWPLGKIPYVMESSVNSNDNKSIMAGIKLIQASTCLRFSKRNAEANYITIRTNDKGGGCFSSGIGMRGKGKQVVNLQRGGCTSASTAAHELLHAAGLYHEHTRADRDKYILVDYDNVCSEIKNNYDRCNDTRYPTESCKSYGYSYNVKSIMHYMGLVTDRNFAVNPKKPIMISRDKKRPIPNTDNDKITKQDAGKINYMYNNCQGAPR